MCIPLHNIQFKQNGDLIIKKYCSIVSLVVETGQDIHKYVDVVV